MAARVSYNVPYNPSEWTSGSRRSSQNEAVNPVNPEDGVAVPPPPYSPPHNRTSHAISEGIVASPAETSYSSTVSSRNPSQLNTPTSTAGVLSPGSHVPWAVRDSVVPRAAANISPSSMHIPPPPHRGMDGRRLPTAGRARPVSVSALSQVVTHSQPEPQRNWVTVETESALQPPAAKRAASAGAVSSCSSSLPSREPSDAGSSRRSWRPGMPLPGPPPGPPPAASRSQSESATSSIDDGLTGNGSGARHGQAYRVPLHAPMLSPMPPTPAGWSEEQPMQNQGRSPVPLQIRTSDLSQASSSRRRPAQPHLESIEDATSATRSSSGLNRSSAVRDSSVKGLRERRSLRKSISDSDAASIAALVVNTNPWSTSLKSKANMLSPGQFSDSQVPGKAREDDLFESIEADRPSTSRSASFARRTRTDWVASQAQQERYHVPVSPVAKMHKLQTGANSNTQGHKPLPTPPLSQKAPASAQSVLPSSNASLPDFDRDFDDKFASDSLSRHRDFLAKESQAGNDEERLQLFADYIIGESVLRRKRYSAARQVDLIRIRQRLFDENDPAAVAVLRPSAAVSAIEETRPRPEAMWWKDFHPALSPIASMSNDEMSSRGRTSSRWWESQTGGSQGEQRPVRRSKRESKYMGLSTAVMNTVDESDTPTRLPDSAGLLGPDDYPDEKADPDTFGFYEDRQHSRDSMTVQGSPGLMDISRFITLPPSYPRHYPAVNNSHPHLASYRLTVRSLSDLSEIKSRKSRHQISLEGLRNEHRQKIADGRQNFKNNIQAQIAEGSITYAEAAEAEAALRVEEHQADKEALQAEFDTLQDVVINPLHDMLNDRLVQLNASISELISKITTDAAEHNPDRPQQEGDDTPELLEYLTQLKWLYETRETVHREIFELLTDRNEKYKEIVVLPYRQANNHDKARDTEAFFTRDSTDRRRAFCEQSLRRHQELFQMVENNVARGVELQSSAFWDIAPGILDLLHKMSAKGDVNTWHQLEIPEHEYLENPSYYRFPQQYLYTLLDHAEKSTYQFIEGQVNLHCLLHEVKSARLLAECRIADVGGDQASEGLADYRQTQEAVLTSELKQRVGIIEEQWAEALGSALQEMRVRVRGWLEERGGWEEMENVGGE